MDTSTILHSGKKVYVAFELGNKTWRLAFSDGQRPRQKVVAARDTKAVLAEIAKTKVKFGLPPDAAVVSCYEAGRDGNWLHRFLTSQGITNVIVDSASIEVNRRARRAKTDRMDAAGLLSLLVRHERGEKDAWRTVRVVEEAQEDERRLHRERERLVKEHSQHRTRIRALLATQGVAVGGQVTREGVTEIRDWQGKALAAHLADELGREAERLSVVAGQIDLLDGQIMEQQKTGTSPIARQSAKLARLRAIGPIGARTLSAEFFGWRTFRNGKEVGALAGLTGTPYNSGQRVRDQGISKAGNRRVRAIMVELAWGWLRYQPQSGLSEWYRSKYGSGGRARRKGVVALARRLLIALWRYAQHDVVPAGANLRTA